MEINDQGVALCDDYVTELINLKPYQRSDAGRNANLGPSPRFFDQ